MWARKRRGIESRAARVGALAAVEACKASA
jgi:hypothetical protein